MDDTQFNTLIGKIDVLTKITAASLLQGKPLAESILLLAPMGFQNKEIAEILGTTAAYVNKVKSQAKHPKKPKTKSKNKG